MRWTVHGRRQTYTSEWVNIWVDDVEANGRRFDHHVIRIPKPTVGAVVVDEHDRVLLLWRHRFITDSWGWEIPAGWVEPDEDLAHAAKREVEEETGWRPGAVEPLVDYHTLSGLMDLQMHIFLATKPVDVGPITDGIESSSVDWVPVQRLPDLAAKGEIPDGPSLTGLLFYLSTRGTDNRREGP